MVLAMLVVFGYVIFVLIPTGKEDKDLRLAAQSADVEGQDELLREAAQANPLAWEPALWRGRTWQMAARSGRGGGQALDLEKAITAYRDALQRQPLLRTAYIAMAECRLAAPGALDDPAALREASQDLEAAVRLYPTHIRTRLRLADVLDRLKDDRRAAAEYERVLELDRQMPEPGFRLSDKDRQAVETRLAALKESLAPPPARR
jgi:tetratricopeptide (TPR) repeat protein